MLPEFSYPSETHRQSPDLSQTQLRRLQAQRQQQRPHWSEPLPTPPEVEFQAAANDDLKMLALLAAVRQLSDEHGGSVASQLDTWNYGRG